MPIERRPPPEPQSHPELVDLLAAELSKPTKGGPRVIEEQLRGMKRFHVTVIWDRWKNVYPDDRSTTILDAYQQAFDDLRMLQISMALGLTQPEAKRLGVA